MAQTIPINIAVNMQDTQNLGVWPGFVLQLPPFFQGSVKDVAIIGVQPTGNDGGAAFSLANLASYGCLVTITAKPKGDGTQAVYVPTTTLTPTNTAQGLQFLGSLDFRGSTLASAIGTNDSITATLEIEFVINGLNQPAFQTEQCTILAPADAGAVVIPTPTANYLTAAQSAAQFLGFTNANGIGFKLYSADGSHFVYLFCNNDGTLGQSVGTT